MLWIRLPRFRTKITFQLFASGMIMASGEWNPNQRPATFCANSSGWLLPTGVEENVQALRALNLITQNKHLLKIMSRDKAGKLGERKKKCLFQAKNKIRIGLEGRFAKDDIWTNEPWLNVGKKGKKWANMLTECEIISRCWTRTVWTPGKGDQVTNNRPTDSRQR